MLIISGSRIITIQGGATESCNIQSRFIVSEDLCGLYKIHMLVMYVLTLHVHNVIGSIRNHCFTYDESIHDGTVYPCTSSVLTATAAVWIGSDLLE